ncbi:MULTISPECIES: hypothetical protein [Mesorhizobium]|uniref:hypothetical protein n=1 Tax=Mesorhizobium TaxID=68287 RepID=UPI0007ED8BF9|nr:MULTISPECIES: hypothetical protein [Mesorhizobium]PBB51868.1 hypothetical protein CK223_32815 [Mesorhizobium loti]QIA25223.1 hypothetical protein A9K68_028110 [Mesorhizobium sp. AA22]
MSAPDPDTLQTESTPQGEQTLIPVSGRSPRATALPSWPTRPRAAQKPLDTGLLNEADRNQLDLI